MSRALVQTIRLTRRCLRSRDIMCFFAGVVLTSCCMILAYPLLLMYNSDCRSELLLEVATTDSVTTSIKSSIINNGSLSTVDLPVIYFITPTQERATQTVDLKKLCQTLILVKNIVWISIEDAIQSPLVGKLLKDCIVQSVHLNMTNSSYTANNKNNDVQSVHSSVDKWNTGLKWLRENIDNAGKGVVYFGYDDSTYDVQLFNEMRFTKIVSVWPIALMGASTNEASRCANGKAVNWNRDIGNDLEFPIHMGAFAINLSIIMSKPHYYIDPSSSEPGALANDFLTKQGITMDNLEPKANNCTTVYVWNSKITDSAGIQSQES